MREFDGEHYVMERGLPVDVALIKAQVADRAGNLRFNKTARNFNPLAAMAGRVCVAEVEESSRPAPSTPTTSTCRASSSTAWCTTRPRRNASRNAP